MCGSSCSLIRSMLLVLLIAPMLMACGGAMPQAAEQHNIAGVIPTATSDAVLRPTDGAAKEPMLERVPPTSTVVRLPATSAPAAVATSSAASAPAELSKATPQSSSAQAAPVPLAPFAAFAFSEAPPSRDGSGNTVYYNADNMIDGQLDTAWRVPGNGVGEMVFVFFDQAVLLSEVWIVPGYAKIDPYTGENRFRQNRRVRSVELTFSGKRSIQARLADRPEYQPIRFQPVVTSFVGVEILETTPHGGRDFTPISEIATIGQVCGPRLCGPMGEAIDSLIASVGDVMHGVDVIAVDETYTYASLWRFTLDRSAPPELGIYKRERGVWKWLTGGTNFDVGFYDVLRRLGVPQSVWP